MRTTSLSQVVYRCALAGGLIVLAVTVISASACSPSTCGRPSWPAFERGLRSAESAAPRPASSEGRGTVTGEYIQRLPRRLREETDG